MFYYFDTSAVVKYYAPEKGSGWVSTVIDSADNSVCVSHIAIVVLLPSAKKYALANFTGEITRHVCILSKQMCETKNTLSCHSMIRLLRGP